MQHDERQLSVQPKADYPEYHVISVTVFLVIVAQGPEGAYSHGCQCSHSGLR